MRPLKILIATERFPPKVFGGGEISAYLFAKELAKKHEVHVITSRNPGEDRNFLIDTSKLHWNKYSVYGKDKIYPIVVIKGKQEVSRAFISLN